MRKFKAKKTNWTKLVSTACMQLQQTLKTKSTVMSSNKLNSSPLKMHKNILSAEKIVGLKLRHIFFIKFDGGLEVLWYLPKKVVHAHPPIFICCKQVLKENGSKELK